MRVRKILPLCFLFAVMLSIPSSANPASMDIPYEVTGGNIWFDAATGSITYCDEEVTEAVIPATIGGVTVVEISGTAFRTMFADGSYRPNQLLIRLELPNTIRYIRPGAFEGVSSLRTLTVPNSVTTIGEGAFYGSNIGSVYILGQVETIENTVFGNCRNLASVAIPSSVIEIGYRAFDECPSLTDIYFAGTPEQWRAIEIDSDNDALNGVTVHYGSTGPDNPGTTQPPTFTLSTPTFGTTIPLVVSGTGTRTVNFVTAFYNTNHRFIGMESAQTSIYPGLRSVFIPINQWAFTPTLKALALDENYRPMSPAAGQDGGIGTTLPDKYADILSESDTSRRGILVNALTEREAKDFIARFAEWVN